MNALAHNTTLLDNSILGSFLSSNSNGKEKDWESGFHYYGARYYWSETLTGWLSVDPMIDKYSALSPYNYCAWNPVKLVDPDGNEALDNDDWYKNNKGEVRWFNSTDKTYTHEGKEYQRVGKTAYMTNSSGEFVYGDQYGHTHESAPLKEVSIVENLTDFERTMRNPLVQSIHRSAADFWGGFVDLGLDVGAKTFTYCGIGVQSIGFYCMLVPGGQCVGAELFAVGRVFSSIGSTLDAINDVKHDDWGGLVTNVLSWSISRLSMKQIDNGISSGFFSLTTNEKNLLNCYISTRTSYITEAINKGRVQQ